MPFTPESRRKLSRAALVVAVAVAIIFVTPRLISQVYTFPALLIYAIVYVIAARLDRRVGDSPVLLGILAVCVGAIIWCPNCTELNKMIVVTIWLGYAMGLGMNSLFNEPREQGK